MSGVKGRSGRQKAPFQQQRANTIDKAWVLLEKFIDDPEIALKEKLDVCKGLAIKSMPDVIEGEGFETNNLVLIRYAGSESKSEALAG